MIWNCGDARFSRMSGFAAPPIGTATFLSPDTLRWDRVIGMSPFNLWRGAS